MLLTFSHETGHIGRWTRRPGTEDFSSKITLATKQDRAIDLSCRAVRVRGRWAWIPGGGHPLRSC